VKRREFVALIGGAMALPARLFAQQAAKMRRIGVLAVGVSTAEQQQMAMLHFSALLRRAGYEEGQNLTVEWRFAEGDVTRLPALADELVRLHVEVIVASFNQSIAVAKRATRTIPVVMLNAISPVEQGFIDSLGRPGGNITGTAWSSPETMGKILQVLKEAAPRATRVAILGNPAGVPGEKNYMAAAQQAGSKLGMSIQFFEATRPEEIAPALERVAAAKSQALFAAVDTILISRLREIAEFALKKKMFSISTAPPFVDVGGLLYYGPDFNELAERTISYVVRILAGAKPADLPVELPSRYQLIINKKTAAAIGHKIPPTLLLRADRVIE
jgi:putative ABC transport system substrate-binding protein